MVALYVQTLLMLGAAYFVGAALACVIRRSVSHERRAPVPAARRVDPLPEAAQRATGPARFGRPSQAEPPRGVPIPQPPTAQPAPPRPAVATAEPAQDLKRIALIDATVEVALNELGVRRYEQIAAWLRPDVQRLSKELGLEDRINRENWIEQAQVLAKGGETHYARRRARGEAANAEPTPDEGERRTPPRPAPLPPSAAPPPRPAARGTPTIAAEIATANIAVAPSPATPQPPPVDTTPANVAGLAAFAAERRIETQPSGLSGQPTAGAMPEPAVPIRPTVASARDNLLRISGIDGETEALLGAEAVTRYSDIAMWSPADVARFDRLVSGAGRIQRENWVEQAQILSRGGDTAFSRDYDRKTESDGVGTELPPGIAEAIRENVAREMPKPDLGSLRSMRGQDGGDEPGPEAALRAAHQDKVVHTPASDDLKRIKGIGFLIEGRLKAIGVLTYEQIANWTAEDVERVSKVLEFKGAAEKDEWIRQARILGYGGSTEFSERYDRGEFKSK